MKNKFLLLLSFLVTTALTLGAQITNSVTYDLRDGSIISAGMSPDGKVKFSGNYSHHGAQYGLNMKLNGVISIDVDGSSTVRFLGSKYSGLNIEGKADVAGDLGVQSSKVTNDLSDVIDFTYSGKAKSLNFTMLAGSGNDLYLPTIEVIPSQEGKTATTAEKNILYYFDMRDGSIIPTNTTGQEEIHLGLIDVLVGTSNAYGYNGAQHGSVLKTGNKINLKVAGNSYIKIGGSIYSNGVIAASSTSGAFNIPSQNSVTTGNFGNDGSTVDFLYVGDAGTVALDFTGTNYIPFIEIVPVPFAVTLTSWVQKTGTITINDVVINLTSGADASSNAVLTLSEGTVISANNENASILINLAGKALSSYQPSFTGNIASADLTDSTITVNFTNSDSDPKSYVIAVADNSVIAIAEPGKTYMYNFADGSEMPQVSYQAQRYTTFVSKDGILTINSNTDVPARQFGYHDASHGGVFFPGNSFNVSVAGDAIVTFFVDTYGVAADGTFEYTNSKGKVLGSTAAVNLGKEDGFPVNFSYKGDADIITATLKSVNFPTAEVYLHGMNIENAPAKEPRSGKVDVWDFGAEQLDTAIYYNVLNEDVINSWYDSTITPGTTGKVLPSFTAGALSFTAGTNDRLRTTNTNLTRYDQNIANSTEYTGRIYVNSGANVNRFLTINLEEDDEVILVTKTDAGGTINFQYVADPLVQQDQVPITSDFITLKFVAKAAGAYRIFDTNGKPSYFRVSRKAPSIVEVTGKLDKSQAEGIPSNFEVVFTNDAGKIWTAPGADSVYTVKLPSGFKYSLSLSGANGYIIGSEKQIDVTDSTKVFDIQLQKVGLLSVDGAISGLGEAISKLKLVFTPDPNSAAIYVPEPVISVENASYTVQLETGVEYTISAEGVNDFYIANDKVTLAQAGAVNIEFIQKSLYPIAIEIQGLTDEQKAVLALKFSNLNDPGYSYSFGITDNIQLRNGVYSIAASGLDAFPVQLSLTSNLSVQDTSNSKTLVFEPVHYWPFDDRVIANGDPAYKGLLFTGTVSNEIAKSHLTAKNEATIKVPVNPGEKVIVQYYYTADFNFDGTQQTTTNSQSTNTLEQVTYVYTGDTAGYVTIIVGAGVPTSYFTNIYTAAIVPYKSTLTVGVDKDFQTINAALETVRNMSRTSGERVSILIDPGNYEEMLDIDMNDLTLKNAASKPSIELANKGVDIAENAVRISSYYGHGYSYFSMTNQKWNSDVLRVNKENGYLSYENKGAGTTNGSYWNATVLVSGSSFVAEDIIFENSFNQYISKKESEDVVVQWTSGGKGERPTDAGNTAVQNRSFVERACAIAFLNNTDKSILYRCRVVGRQDALYGGTGARVVMYKGSAMGAVDYIFGGMDAVFYKTELAMNTSDVSSDQTYITAAQQSSGRGYLMYECAVVSAKPGSESASATGSKPGYFGRPWAATTSEVVFYKTTIDASEFPGSEGKSLIVPLGWQNTLGGESRGMYEFGTIEKSGEDNAAARASWATALATPKLNDGTDITTFNFTKGNDDWDPIPDLIAKEETVRIFTPDPISSIEVGFYGDQIYFTNVKSVAKVNIYDIKGGLHLSAQINGDGQMTAPGRGLWIVTVLAKDGIKTAKVFTN